MKTMRKAFILMAMLTTMLAACSDDEHSPYQMLIAEMADVYTGERQGNDVFITSALTDKDVRLTFAPQRKASWATTPDSVYRALVYYNNVETADPAAPKSVEVLGITPALYLRPHSRKDAKDWYDEQDGVRLTAAWRTERYVNILIDVMTGVADNRTQVFGLVDEGISSADNTIHLFRLCHNQNGVPTAYSQPTYLSIPVKGIPSSHTICVRIPTFDGVREVKL